MIRTCHRFFPGLLAAALSLSSLLLWIPTTTLAQSETQAPTRSDAGVAEAAEVTDAAAPADEVAAREVARSESDAAPSVTFNFQNADWETALKMFAEAAGLTLDLTDTPPGSFNYIDRREHSLPEAVDVLNGYLLPRGYVVVRRDQFLAVLKTDNPILSNLIPTVPAAGLPEYGDHELVRLSVPLRGLDAEEVAEQVQGVLGPHGSAAPLSASDSLLLQGFGRSLREVVRLLEGADVPLTDDELVFRLFPLKAVPAADAERQIRNLFGLTSSNPYAASQARRAEYMRSRSRRGRDNDDRPAGPTPLMANLATNMRVSSLARTNSLLVTATPSAIQLVEEILKSLDVPPPDGELSLFDDSTPVLRVYKLQNADEDDVAETIDAILPGVVINEDSRHDSIHIYATQSEHREVEELIRIIDTADGGSGEVEVLTLKGADPVQMADLLDSLFSNERRDDRPVITPDSRTRTLAVRATGNQMEQIKQTLAAYGEGPSAMAGPLDGRIRRIRLPAGNAASIARAVQELLGESDGLKNRIRVVIPSERTQEDARNPESQGVEEYEPVRSQPVDDRSTRTAAEPGSTLLARVSDQDRLSEPLVSLRDRDSRGRTPERGQLPETLRDTPRPSGGPDPEEVVPDPDESDERSRRGRQQRVTIEVRDGELFMYSSDPEALNEVEETIRELVRQMPARTEWTVFYLRAAAAETAALRLQDLLRNESGPLLGLPGPAASDASLDFATAPLRIIPDSRTNALFVSGPQDEVDAAGRFLEFLDRTELPESMRDRVPRAIPVQYANVEAIAEMVRELYKDYLEDPNQRARERRGGDRDDDSRRAPVVPQTPADGLRPPGIRLTVAVDVQANELLVSCNEALFEQIRELVAQRDQAALDSRPAMRVIELQETTARQIGLSLDQLSPRISVSISPQTPPGGSASGSDRRYDRDRSRDRRSRD
jgi:type II secretory pathway component GspD/PulD (secretin)